MYTNYSQTRAEGEKDQNAAVDQFEQLQEQIAKMTQSILAEEVSFLFSYT